MLATRRIQSAGIGQVRTVGSAAGGDNFWSPDRVSSSDHAVRTCDCCAEGIDERSIMEYVTFIIALTLSGFAWKRILQKKDRFLVKLGYFLLACVPIAGPVFYLMIDLPEIPPPAVSSKKFWRPSKGTAVWPSFEPLIKSVGRLFRGK
jgi:hypothetical protein